MNYPLDLKKSLVDSKSIGMVLSGGGIRGMAHIGILEAMSNFGVFPDKLSGVSAGALVAALYANNIAPMDMLHFFKDTPLFKYNFFSLSKPGIIDTEKYLPFFYNYFPINTFEALPKKLFVVTTDLENGISTIFDNGDLIRPVLASAALPPIFSPLMINDTLHADGAIMNNFPLDPIVNNCDITIGSYVAFLRKVTQKEIKNALQLAARTNSLMLYANSVKNLKNIDLLFAPENLEQVRLLDKKGIDKAYTIGYDYASKKLDQLLNS